MLKSISKYVDEEEFSRENFRLRDVKKDQEPLNEIFLSCETYTEVKC